MYCGGVPVNSTHAEYDASAAQWSRARDVLSGEDAVKAAGERYLPRLDSQSEEEYFAYRNRAAFFNATSRTAEGYIGLIFRRPPFVRTPEGPTGATASGVAKALAEFVNDADMLGTSLFGYAKNVISEVVSVGRAGSLVDWEGDFENRVYASLYTAEQIINWRVERVNGRNVPTLVVLKESTSLPGAQGMEADEDAFEQQNREQIRVLMLVDNWLISGGQRGGAQQENGAREMVYQVELWRPKAQPKGRGKANRVKWELVVMQCSPW
jgi:hypothetical protein